VNRIDVSRRWLRAWMRKNRVQLALTLRITVAAVAGLGIAQALALPLPLWTVLTALIVTQMSIGRSLKTSIDYFVGTVGGTIYGAALALLIPHDSEWALLLVLVLAVAPVALVAALKRNLNAVPVSSIIVVLMPALAHAGPLDSAIYRVLEVGLGVVVGLVVAFLVLPAGGHRLARQEAARTLDLLAQALGRVLAGPLAQADIEALRRTYDSIGQSLLEFTTSAAEGERERSARLSVEPDTQPLRRTLLRLRHDVVTVGRIARAEPLPEPVHGRLAPRLAAIGQAGGDYLKASGMALATRRPPPSEIELEKAFVAALAETTALRREGFTRELTDEAVGRFFALAFSLEEMRRTFRDLGHDVEVTALAPEAD
jgi:Fusaric acid resistance protein family